MNNEFESNPKELSYDPEIEKLLGQFSESREELSKYMGEVEDIRKKVEAIFPTTTDFRNKFVLEEKIKAMSAFYSTLLNIRQEFNKSIKEEIELRRKMSSTRDGTGEDKLDLRAIASMVEEELKNKGGEPEESIPIEDLEQVS
jgi:uncharacterized coiled-coil DUF342 family protein